MPLRCPVEDGGPAGVAFVEDDDARCACGLRVLHLRFERAGTALDQRDLSRETGEVAGGHPLAELGVGVGGMTMPPAGLIWETGRIAVANVLARKSLTSVKLRAVGEASLNVGVPTNEKYGNVYVWIVTL